MLNEIVTHKDNTKMIAGSIAHKVFFGRLSLPDVFKLEDSEQYALFELVDNTLILRAYQSNKENVISYVKGDSSNYLLVYNE